jgi:hypothetical protein
VNFSCTALWCRSIKISQGKALPMMPPVRRSLAVLIAALLAGLFAVAGISAPANAAPKASLKIVSVTNAEKTELGSLLRTSRPSSRATGRVRQSPVTPAPNIPNTQTMLCCVCG